MRRRFASLSRFASFLFSALVFGAFVAFAGPASGKNEPGPVETFFDSFFFEEMRSKSAPGAVAAFVDCSGAPVLKGYGFSDASGERKADPHKTLFMTGSVTKLITATAVMKLCAMGLIKLDDRVSSRIQTNFLKEIKDRPVTFKSLLTHTAGFDSNPPVPLFFEKKAVPKSLRDFLEAFCPRCVRPPLKKFEYSNFSAGLSGLLVAEISGVEYCEYVRKNIFDKLDMKNSFFSDRCDGSLEIAVGYEASESGFVPVEKKRHTMMPASGLLTTAADMANFMTAHLQSGNFHNYSIWGETVSVEMQKSFFRVDRRSIPENFDRYPELSSMAAGFRVSEQGGVKILWHSGTLKGYAAGLYLFPELRCGVFIAYNSGDSRMRQRFIKRFVSAVIKKIDH